MDPMSAPILRWVNWRADGWSLEFGVLPNLEYRRLSVVFALGTFPSSSSIFSLLTVPVRNINKP